MRGDLIMEKNREIYIAFRDERYSVSRPNEFSFSHPELAKKKCHFALLRAWKKYGMM